MHMKHIRISTLLLAMLVLMSCVTINIYFPAAAAEKAADRIIEDIWGKQPGEGEDKKPQQTPSSDAGGAQVAFDILHGVMRFVISDARAAADINISTPAIDALRGSMKARHAQLEPYYNSGAVGLTRDALITVRDVKAVALRERALVNKLVAQENRDRIALYNEIARANGHPEWADDIRKTFAQRWISNARAGWWYQDSSGNWKQK
jgi:uncharacterized protein YdbL (DUF1318 family)